MRRLRVQFPPAAFMSERVFIGDKNKTRVFFELTRQNSGFSSWSDFGNSIGLSRSEMGYVLAGQRSIPSELFEQLLVLVPKTKRSHYQKTAIRKPKNWGQKLAGKITYSRHKELFERGRLISNKKRKEAVKFKFDINQPLSQDLSEFLGAFAGDGFTNQYGPYRFQTGFAGDSRFDFDYYQKRIIPITKQLFNFKTIKIHKKK
ncbi:MAG: hypothetical protein HYW50_02120 [Candidatus Diapherotrites archaeon]|nr:hypothetical protein [Candidatus Diapherotrites archaeon]